MDRDVLARALRVEVEGHQAQLLAKVQSNLSGDVLQSRSGALKESIVATIEYGEDGVSARVASVGVPYAAIQEHGGRTAPHEIVPLKARALAIAGIGFARRTRHPGSTLPARSYLDNALEAMRAEIETGLKGTVRAALDAD